MTGDAVMPGDDSRVGRLIVLEGIDGAGKTSLVQLLHDWLVDEMKVETVCGRDPGTTKFGEAARRLFYANLALPARLSLHMAVSAQLTCEFIRPALRERKVVLLDRYTDSTRAYQIGGGGLPALTAEPMIGIYEERPDLTIILNVDWVVAIDRKLRQNLRLNPLEIKTPGYFDRVISSYRYMARLPRHVLVDAHGRQAEVAERVKEVILSNVDLPTQG